MHKRIENKTHRAFSESYSEPLKAALLRRATVWKLYKKNTKKHCYNDPLGPEQSSILDGLASW